MQKHSKINKKKDQLLFLMFFKVVKKTERKCSETTHNQTQKISTETILKNASKANGISCERNNLLSL